MDSFTLVVVAGLGLLGLVFWLIGRYYPGSGLEQLGLQSARELTERREALEAEDLDQMLTALLLPPPGAQEPAHDLDYLTNFERKFRKAGKPIYRASYQKEIG